MVSTELTEVRAEARLAALGIQLPQPPEPLGAYVEAVRSGQLLFLSGMLPVVEGRIAFRGRIGEELQLEDGRAALRLAGLNALASIRQELGSIDRVKRVVRVAAYLVAAPDFVDHAKVADGASELLESIFGREKTSVRIVLGVASLPLGSPVALEVTVEADKDTEN